MIITWLTGGLGNQMFQYAAGLSLAHRRRTVLKLDVSWFREDPEFESHNRYALECLNISEQFATEREIDRLRGVALTRSERLAAALARRLHFYQHARHLDLRGNRHSASSFAFSPEFFDLPDHTYLEGMWQSEKFFSPIADLVRQHFSFKYPASEAVIEMMRRIGAGPSMAVHFRRGDYIRSPQFAKNIGVLGLDYYHRAVEMLLRRNRELKCFVFSDDIDAVEREFRPDCECHFVRATGEWNAFDKIRLMSRCSHAIIANSTFSWWGAWLGEKPGQVVIAPEAWFAKGSPHDASDLVPERWIRC